MIISKGRGYVFVHIPKTGGTSLAAALEDRAMKDDVLIGDTPKARRRKHRLEGLCPQGRLWKHSTLADIDGVLSPADLAAMFTFTLVRNPWDRVVSYYHWLKVQNFDHPGVAAAKTLPFGIFLKVDHVQASLHQSPASSYMRDAGGTERCNAFIRLEAFEQDAASLVAHLGFPVSLPHVNGSERHDDFRRYYDTGTREIVADLCAEDISRFGYRFDSER